MERFTYIIGDIHGCYESLMALEECIHRHAEQYHVEPFIVSVGDLIDRGPQSRDVVRHFQWGVRNGTHCAVAGNHEAVLFEVFLALCYSEHHDIPVPDYVVPLQVRYEREESLQKEPWEAFVERKKTGWLHQGGHDTLRSFGCIPEKPATWVEAHEELRFLATLPMLWESKRSIVTHALASTNDIAYVHRLTNHAIPPDKETLVHALHMWGLLWNRDLPEHGIDTERTHISGHTTSDDVVYLGKQRRIMIDTACVYGNKLTAWCEHTETILQVKGVQR